MLAGALAGLAIFGVVALAWLVWKAVQAIY